MEDDKKVYLAREFKKFDKDKNGYLDTKEIKLWLASMAHGIEITLSDEDVNKLIELVDKNADGKLTCDEFIKLL